MKSELKHHKGHVSQQQHQVMNSSLIQTSMIAAELHDLYLLSENKTLEIVRTSTSPLDQLTTPRPPTSSPPSRRSSSTFRRSNGTTLEQPSKFRQSRSAWYHRKTQEKDVNTPEKDNRKKVLMNEENLWKDWKEYNSRSRLRKDQSNLPTKTTRLSSTTVPLEPLKQEVSSTPEQQQQKALQSPNIITLSLQQIKQEASSASKQQQQKALQSPNIVQHTTLSLQQIKQEVSLTPGQQRPKALQSPNIVQHTILPLQQIKQEEGSAPELQQQPQKALQSPNIKQHTTLSLQRVKQEVISTPEQQPQKALQSPKINPSESLPVSPKQELEVSTPLQPLKSPIMNEIKKPCQQRKQSVSTEPHILFRLIQTRNRFIQRSTFYRLLYHSPRLPSSPQLSNFQGPSSSTVLIFLFIAFVLLGFLDSNYQDIQF